MSVSTTPPTSAVAVGAEDAPSTWRSRMGALGPGILMASAAVGGSHLIASTQAGALYGWQLAIIIVLANLFKYPFFRFGSEYTLANNESLLVGYARNGRAYIWGFFTLNIFSAVINTAGVSIVSAAILSYVLPGVPMTWLVVVVLGVSMFLLVAGKYALLDGLSKFIMISLTAATVTAVVIAMGRGAVAPVGYVGPSPWNLMSLSFIVALMGWMPAPIEISALTSMWVAAKREKRTVSLRDGLFDFNVGYISTAVLAIVFLALGALVQYGSGTPVQMVGGAYINQLINMYASTIGEWSRYLVVFIAFACMFGTTLTVIDGYSRTNMESLRIIKRAKTSNKRALDMWIVATTLLGFVVVFQFKSAVGPMLQFAMIASFVTTPLFAWLNLRLVSKGHYTIAPWLKVLAWVGLTYLSAFALLFIAQLSGVLG